MTGYDPDLDADVDADPGFEMMMPYHIIHVYAGWYASMCVQKCEEKRQ